MKEKFEQMTEENHKRQLDEAYDKKEQEVLSGKAIEELKKKL